MRCALTRALSSQPASDLAWVSQSDRGKTRQGTSQNRSLRHFYADQLHADRCYDWSTEFKFMKRIAVGNLDEALHKDCCFVAVTLTFVRWRFGSHVNLSRCNSQPTWCNFHLWPYTWLIEFPSYHRSRFSEKFDILWNKLSYRDTNFAKLIVIMRN